jgi:hypothetical protein
LSASYIALSASYNVFSGSASTRITTVSSSQQDISASLLQVSASYISLSGSYNIFSGSASTRITVDSASLLQVSSSQQQVSSSYIALSASYNTFSGSASTRTTQIEQVYATTGSNSFRANQSITGSLVVSSTITAQTLVVQTVTSSIVYSSGSNIFGNQSTDRQTFTGSILTSGNIGLGITPSAWNSIYRVFQIDAGSISSSPSYNNISVASNVFYNAGNSPRYIVSDYATLYGQDDGLHAWYTAPSGTAGAAMTFTQSMTLTAASNLGIGYSNPNAFVASSGYGNLVVGSGTGAQGMTIFGGTTGQSGLMFADATSGTGAYTGYVLYSHSTDKMELATGGGTPRVTITSDGVKFQNGATSLNYYEEGTFNPTNLSQNFDAVTVISGRYVRIGNQVTINCRWNVTASTTGMKYLVFDLPFAFFNNNNINFTGIVSNYNNGASSASSNVGTSVRNTAGSTTQQYIQAYYTSTASGDTLLFSMTYQTF